MAATSDWNRICHYIAHHVYDDLHAAGFSPEWADILAGAKYGVWRASLTYDPDKGAKDTTHAWPTIKRYATLWGRESAGLTSRGDGFHTYRIEPHEDDWSDDPVERWTTKVTVRQAVSQLPDDERLLLWLLFWEDLRPLDVEARMSLSRGQFRCLRDRALDHLREEIAGVNRCKVCGKPDYRKPMCFRGVPWCCDLHRKVIQGEITIEQADEAMHGGVIRESDVMR